MNTDNERLPMRVLLQRVSSAEVKVDGQVTGRIDSGLVVFFCAMNGDDCTDVGPLVKKIINLRIFQDVHGKMNLSLAKTGGSVLVVSQFTLAADTSRGHRPGFSAAAGSEIGEALYMEFANELRQYCHVETGVFGADMKVSLTNDGPVTIWLER